MTDLYPTDRAIFKGLRAYPTLHGKLFHEYVYLGENFAILSPRKYTRFAFYPTDKSEAARDYIRAACKGKKDWFPLPFWTDFTRMSVIEYGGCKYNPSDLAQFKTLFDKAFVLPNKDLLLSGRYCKGVLKGEK